MAVQAYRDKKGYEVQEFHDPAWVSRLFNSPAFSWIWLIARVYVGWNWLSAGWGKVTGQGWMDGGSAIAGFWQRAIVVPDTGRPVIAYDWYREFLAFMLNNGWQSWFGPAIAIGETMVGAVLILGMLTGIAAFFGAFMNWNFMLAGTASTNPVLGLIGIGTMIAWKIAGWWGVDRFLLSLLGAPWKPGKMFGGATTFGLPKDRKELARAVEEWALMLTGVGLELYALIKLDGYAQLVIFLAAAILIAGTGLGWITREPQTRFQAMSATRAR